MTAGAATQQRVPTARAVTIVGVSARRGQRVRSGCLIDREGLLDRCISVSGFNNDRRVTI